MKFSRNIYLTVIVLAVLALFMVSGCGNNGDDTAELESRISELESENAALQTENDELTNTVTTLEAQIAALENGDTPQLQINRKPHDGWEDYFPDAETTTLEGQSTAELRTLLGEPPFLIRSIAVQEEASREIWVFVPFDQDPTGLYLYFKGGELDSSRLDEFNGLYGSGLLDSEAFWLQ